MTDLGNIKIKKINHVAIPINNRKESFSLYRDFLGLTIIPSMVDEKHVIWSKTADGTMVHLIEPPDGPGNDLVSFHVAFEVENFDETVEILKKSSSTSFFLTSHSKRLTTDSDNQPQVFQGV